MIRKLFKFFTDKRYWIGILSRRGFFDKMPDDKYLKMVFEAEMGYPLDLENPKTFNEKLQWLKLYDRKPEYTRMVDKYEVKKYVAEKIGEEYIIPTYGVWDRFDDIDFDILPDQFVLKTTHDSGGVVICRDKANFDIRQAKKKLEKSLERNYYLSGREWPYKDVKPRILAEKYMVDESEYELKDYKVFNFDGESKLIQVDFDRFSEHKRNLYSKEWERIAMEIEFRSDSSREIAKPENLEEMLSVARTLSEGIPHVRTDFYNINNRLYFGELTLYHGSGMEKITPKTWNDTLGEWIKLPGGGI